MRTYNRGGKTYLSVTEIVGMIYPFDKKGFESWARWQGFNPDWITNEAIRIGTMAHQWVENRHYGIQDWADTQPRGEKEKGYQGAAQKFFDIVGVDDCEQTVYCDKYGYAGTYDIRRNNTLYDIKTWGSWKGEYKRSEEKLKKVAVQLSMYRYATGEDLEIVVAILLPDGNVELEDLEIDETWQEWVEENADMLRNLI